MKKIDMINKRFGKTVVIEEVKQKTDPSGRKRRKFLCECDCGKEFTATGESLRYGKVMSCGCLRKEMLSERREKDLTGKTFGRWYIEGEAFRDKYGIHWNAICECGNRGTPTTGNLLKNITKSCGCYNLERISERERKDITNQKFYKLLAIECVGKDKYNNYLWRCKCDCGREIIAPAARLLGGQTISCGCTKSKGECIIEDYLKERSIAYERYAHFDDLKLKSYLYFDFMLKDKYGNKYLIEFQGEQYYFDLGYFGKQQRETTDKMKKVYCIAHDIPLFEIRYDENIIERMNEIVAQVNPVPSSDIAM